MTAEAGPGTGAGAGAGAGAWAGSVAGSGEGADAAEIGAEVGTEAGTRGLRGGLQGVLDELYKTHQTATASKALKFVREALADPLMQFKLAAATVLAQPANMLIKQAGADSCNVAPNVISDALNMKTTLEKFRDTPVIMRERMIALLEIPQVAGRPMPVKLGLSDADVALLDGFITAAAAAALTKSHHIDDMAEAMRRSRMYDWRVDHDEDCDTSNAAHPERRTKEWFGVLDFSWEEYGDNIDAEYKRWNAHLKTLDPEVRKNLNSSIEWKKCSQKFPRIYKAARWHCAIALASGSVERVFARMRKMEASDRLTMEEDSFVFELFFRCNQWLVDMLWQEDLAALPRSSAAAAAAAAALPR